MKSFNAAILFSTIFVTYSFAADDHGVKANPQYAARTINSPSGDCAELVNGQTVRKNFAAAVPSVVADDSEHFYGRDDLGGRKILEQNRIGYSIEDGIEKIRYRMVSAEEDNAVEITMMMKDGAIQSYETNLTCGDGFGFGRPHEMTSNISAEMLQKLEDLVGAKEEARLNDALGRVNGTDEIAERGKGGGGGGGGGGSSRSSGGGSSHSSGGSSSRPSSSGSGSRSGGYGGGGSRMGGGSSPKPSGGSGASGSGRGSSGWTSGNPFKSGSNSKPSGSVSSKPSSSGSSKPSAPSSSTKPSAPTTSSPSKPSMSGKVDKAPVTHGSSGVSGMAKSSKPLSTTPITSGANKGGRVDDHGSHKIELDSKGNKLNITGASGKTTHFDPATGKVTKVEKPMGKDTAGHPVTQTTHLNNDGSRIEKVNGKVVSTTSAPQKVGNKTYVTKTIVNNNNTTVNRTYHAYSSGGYSYYGYVPYGGYYSPGYYGWAFGGPGYIHPWHVNPYAYSWGWYADPWYSPYSYYYTPYPVYYSPFSWLVDFTIADSIRNAHAQNESRRRDDAYQRGFDRGVADGSRIVNTNPRPIDNSIKEQLAAQAEEIMKLQQKNHQLPASAPKEALPLDAILKDTKRVWPVKEDLEVPVLDKKTFESNGQVCSLSAGDFIKLAAAMNDSDLLAKVVVMNSKKNSCPPMTVVSITKEDLFSLINGFAETVSDGAEAMAKDKNIKIESK